MHPEFVADFEFSKLRAGHCTVDLVGVMLELAADAYPDVDRLGCRLEIDRLSVACDTSASRLGRWGVRDYLAHISRVLYDVEGFHGNRDSYYSPENSYLNEVLARRVGIPISLGILYMAVAERAGVPVFGVNTPGHFVIGCRSGNHELYVDPFTGGDVLDRAACRQRIEETVGRRGIVFDEHFRPAAPRDVVVRVLRNLKAAYGRQSRWDAVLTVQRRLSCLLPASQAERRDLASAYLRAGDPRRALDVLSGCTCQCDGEQAAVESGVRAARRMVAELN